jgi:hypothetical protein
LGYPMPPPTGIMPDLATDAERPVLRGTTEDHQHTGARADRRLFAPTRESFLSLYVLDFPSLSTSAGRLPPIAG